MNATLPSRPMKVPAIIEEVARYYDVTAEQITGPCRRASFVLPRHVCFYLARRLTKRTFDEIGEHIGGRDHHTIIHGVKRVTDQLESDPRLVEELRHLERRLSVSPEVSP